jgi:hypothetical protein
MPIPIYPYNNHDNLRNVNLDYFALFSFVVTTNFYRYDLVDHAVIQHGQPGIATAMNHVSKLKSVKCLYLLNEESKRLINAIFENTNKFQKNRIINNNKSFYFQCINLSYYVVLFNQTNVLWCLIHNAHFGKILSFCNI